jgi:hypothetical protein
MTVTAVGSGTIAVGQVITGTGVTAGTVITAQLRQLSLSEMF